MNQVGEIRIEVDAAGIKICDLADSALARKRRPRHEARPFWSAVAASTGHGMTRLKISMCIWRVFELTWAISSEKETRPPSAPRV